MSNFEALIDQHAPADVRFVVEFPDGSSFEEVLTGLRAVHERHPDMAYALVVVGERRVGATSRELVDWSLGAEKSSGMSGDVGAGGMQLPGIGSHLRVWWRCASDGCGAAWLTSREDRPAPKCPADGSAMVLDRG